MIFQFEYTDTFNGEANYSWVRRTEIDLPETVSDLTLSIRAKRWAGLTGHSCRRVDVGEGFALYPSGVCTVLFITPVY